MAWYNYENKKLIPPPYGDALLTRHLEALPFEAAIARTDVSVMVNRQTVVGFFFLFCYRVKN